ncbi:amine oxidase [Kwoniella heveanensis CBS 569]|nr:amine oxidase [Kwoniella heveanensis CBS 569]
MRVAIIGGGVAGLSSLWTLNGYSDHEVHIYEKADWWGGHAHTVEFQQPGKEKCDIDTSTAILQIAINSRNYPNFYKFLRDSSIDLIKTTMSFSLSRDKGAFEWASDDLWALFCQSSNFFKPQIYRMMWDIFRFNLFATDFLSETGEAESMSIGEYLDREGYSKAFKEDYLLPLTAGIWSIPPEKVALDFPSMALIRFFHNHQMLQLWGKPDWLTVKGGSKTYVEQIIKQIDPSRLHLNVGVTHVKPVEGGVWITTEDGRRELFDKVIIATHTDQAVQLLGENISPDERRLLGDCQWSANEAVVHYDEDLMPTRKRAWTAWNYLTSTVPVTPSHESKTTASDVSAIAITFNLNILQSLPVWKHGQILVTLNPPVQPAASKTLSRWTYHHPELTPALLRAQKELPAIQGKRGIYFAGAWTGYGFHEDGWTAGMEIAYRPEFGLAEKPWEIMRVSGRGVQLGRIERNLRFVVGTVDWGVKSILVWIMWTLNLYLSILRSVFGVERDISVNVGKSASGKKEYF